MRAPRVELVFLAALLCFCPAGRIHAQTWQVKTAAGLAYNLPLPLSIEQDRQPTIRLHAHFDTRAFAQPPYYMLRVERSTPAGSWGLELLHHKLYLQNRPPEVERFDISHGFNVISLLRGFGDTAAIGYHAGVGVVVTHPENTIRGSTLNGRGLGGGYYLSGAAMQLGVVATRNFVGEVGAVLEAKLLAAYASVPVENGNARLWHASAHALAGLNYNF